MFKMCYEYRVSEYVCGIWPFEHGYRETRLFYDILSGLAAFNKAVYYIPGKYIL